MCDVMPTISEDGISQRTGQYGSDSAGGDEANFEQLMVNMLDERDKLMESLREAQEELTEIKTKLTDVEKERDSLQRQLNAHMPQVCFGILICLHIYYNFSFAFFQIEGILKHNKRIKSSSRTIVRKR